MAWLQNLAGKAEDLLVKFDQNAANVLNDSNPKLVENLESIEISTSNIIEPSYELNSSAKLSQSDVAIVVESKSTSNLKNWGKAHSFGDSSDLCTFNDNVSIISEKSRVSDNEDSGIVFNATGGTTKRDRLSPVYTSTTENLMKKETKSDYSAVSSKSGSLQNSFILMDDSVIKYDEKIQKLERENEEFNHQLMNMRHLYSEVQNENSNLQSQLDRVNEALNLTKNEMEQYRARAQRILQEKEKLIGLKQNTITVGPIAQDEIMMTYNEGLKKELAFQEEKYKELSEKLFKTNHELSTLQSNFVIAQKENQTSKQALQETLMNERKVRANVEEECHIKTKELHSALNELAQQNSIVANKTQEMFQLREQLKQRTAYVVHEDLESRLQSLTQTLMSKQSTLETVTTERNALRLQLEKLENEHHKVILQIQRSKIKSLEAIEPDEVRSQVPHFLKISPFDAGVTRRVKRAYSCLNAVSIRTGVFLRRYPVARVFVFCYMVLLHLWVLIILCTYVPTSS